MRFAGTCRRYSKSAIPQLTSAATYHLRSPTFFRCAYHAKVMKTLDAMSSGVVRRRIAFIVESSLWIGEQTRLSNLCGAMPRITIVLLLPDPCGRDEAIANLVGAQAQRVARAATQPIEGAQNVVPRRDGDQRVSMLVLREPAIELLPPGEQRGIGIHGRIPSGQCHDRADVHAHVADLACPRDSARVLVRPADVPVRDRTPRPTLDVHAVAQHRSLDLGE